MVCYNSYHRLNHMHSLPSQSADVFCDVDSSCVHTILRKRINAYECAGSPDASTRKTCTTLERHIQLKKYMYNTRNTCTTLTLYTRVQH